jgi:hypothetical protein
MKRHMILHVKEGSSGTRACWASPLRELRVNYDHDGAHATTTSHSNNGGDGRKHERNRGGGYGKRRRMAEFE